MKLTNLRPPTIIFSVEKDSSTLQDNRARSYSLRFLLKSFGVPFKEVAGRYKGYYERSFVVHAKHEPLIAALCWAGNQDTYLYLNEYRDAYLTGVTKSYDHPARTHMGKWVHAHSKPEGDYTRDGEHYYEVI